MNKFIEKNFRTPIRFYRNTLNFLEEINNKLCNFIISKQKFGIYSRRVKETISCKDSNYIPKVEDAGKIYFGENNQKYQLMHNGVKVILGGYFGDWMTEIIYKLKGHHEPQEEKVFFEILKQIPNNACMIELGSFWAYYSLWFQKSIKNASNYMIEPNSDNIQIGINNFEINNFQGTFLNAYLDETYAENSVFLDWDGAESSQPRVSVDYLINQKYNLNYVHILHSDIQGYEHKMLKGCRESVTQNKIGYFIISTHGDDIHKECIEILEKEYKCKIIAAHKPSESFSADGLIAAVAQHVINSPKRIEISKKKRCCLFK